MTAVVFGAPIDIDPMPGYFFFDASNTLSSSTTVTIWLWPYAPGQPWPRSSMKSRRIRA